MLIYAPDSYVVTTQLQRDKILEFICMCGLIHLRYLDFLIISCPFGAHAIDNRSLFEQGY